MQLLQEFHARFQKNLRREIFLHMANVCASTNPKCVLHVNACVRDWGYVVRVWLRERLDHIDVSRLLPRKNTEICNTQTYTLSVHTQTYIHTYTYMRLMSAHMQKHTHAHTASVHTHTQTQHTYTHTYTCTHNAHTCVHTRWHHVHTDIYVSLQPQSIEFIRRAPVLTVRVSLDKRHIAIQRYVCVCVYTCMFVYQYVYNV